MIHYKYKLIKLFYNVLKYILKDYSDQKAFLKAIEEMQIVFYAEIQIEVVILKVGCATRLGLGGVPPALEWEWGNNFDV